MSHDSSYLDNLRHSAAHLLAAAIMDLYPGTKRTIGPSIDNGFYFDFEFEQPFSEDDFKAVELRMRQLLKSWKGFEHHEVSEAEARAEYEGNPYKQELIDEILGRGEKLTFYKSGEYWDLCRGGHVENPIEELKHFKLLSVAGAYWRGDEKNAMLTRIYGTAFPSAEELKTYLEHLEEAKKRDHRKLGKELDLFVFSDLVGSGLPLYTPRGAYIRRELQKFVGELQGAIGYQEVWTPQVTRAEFFKVSGHYQAYKENMFSVKSNYSDEEFFLKPMNCPMHAQIFASQQRSYRDLPLRFCDYANLYRDEKPGELSGLTRLRAFSQDDGHCFCREDQIEEEFTNVANIVKQAIAAFGMKYTIRLSLWDPQHKENYLGSEEVWERAQKALQDIVSKLGVEYEAVEGEAAIYGPKMDFIAVDALDRKWQISTIQLDFIQPERFGLKYTDQNGELQMPVMIHRAILGSPERFMGLLLEHFAGALPLWLSPLQVVVVPITQDHNDYAEEVTTSLLQAGLRAENWNQAESMQKRIRTAEKAKVPFMLIVGGQEMESKTVAVRQRGTQSQDSKSVDEVISQLKEQITSRAL
jgi:threonyl-tRNA synthetase